MATQEVTTPTLGDFVADLIYENYRFNRQHSPSVSVERWARVYGTKQTAEFETRYQQQLLRIFTPRHVNELVLCDATVDCDCGGKGNGYACNRPTVQCPGCGEGSGACPEHLFEQPDGTRVCVECDGSPQFKKPGPDAADLYELKLAGKAGA